MSSKLRTTEASASQSGNAELGDLSFDDWYETPVFEAEPDERLEHLATSRRAPMRLVAGALLRIAPAPRRRDRHDGPVAEVPVAEIPVVESPVVDTEAPRPAGASGSWRTRTGRFLDRWAAMETASQERLEAVVLPKRWRG